MVITAEELSKISIKNNKKFILVAIFILVLYYTILFLIFSLYFIKLQNLILFFILLLLFLNLSIIFFLSFEAYQILIILFLEIGILAYFLKEFSFNFIVLSLAIFFILSLIAVISIKENVKSSLKIKWFSYFKILWNFYIFIFLLILLSYIIFDLNLQSLDKNKIENYITYIEKISYLFKKENFLNMKIAEVVLKNLNDNLDEESKRLAIKLYINELNKKFSINLNENSTIKSAISEYIFTQMQLLKGNTQKELKTRIILGILIILIMQSIFYLLGVVISVFSYLIFLIFLGFNIIKIEKEITEKEVLKF